MFGREKEWVRRIGFVERRRTGLAVGCRFEGRDYADVVGYRSHPWCSGRVVEVEGIAVVVELGRFVSPATLGSEAAAIAEAIGIVGMGYTCSQKGQLE